MAKFTSLEIENTMAIKVAEIKPTGEPITTIGGKTAQGKSTALKCVEMLLDGAKAVPDEPLRRGTKKGHIRGEIDGGPDGGGFAVERKITRRGTSLVVTGKEGTPQALMDQIKGGCAQDLGKIARMKNPELLAIMRELVPGLDFIEHNAAREAIYEDRAEANRAKGRAKTQLDATTRHDDAPDAEVSVAELATELTARQEINQKNATRRAALCVVADEYRTAQTTVERSKKALIDAEDRLREAETALGNAAKKGQALKGEVAGLRDTDTGEIKAQLATVDDANRKVRENREHARLAEALATAERETLRLNRKLDGLDEEKAALIAAAEYPVKGLTVDDETVMLHGFAWDQASRREQLVASAEIALAQSPDLREFLVDEGSAFDEESKIALGEWADANDSHVWMVVVSAGEGCSIVFHEGEIVDIDAGTDAGTDAGIDTGTDAGTDASAEAIS